MTEEPFYLCPDCMVGRLQPRTAPFFAEMHGLPVTVPEFPAWICDVCGWTEYDQLALSELEAMLNIGRPRGRRRRRRLPKSKRLPAKASTSRGRS